jgi:hypothetical protein
MKILISVASAALVLSAGVAAAQTTPAVVSLNGSAERACTLPPSWSFVSQNGGASGANFTGTTWTIPAAAFADATSNAAIGAEYAIRVRGTGFCNASHTIRLQSSRGGLVAGDPAVAAPSGFTKRRAMTYGAHWSGAGGPDNRNPFGPSVEFTPASAGQQSAPANYVVSGSLAPPGNRIFDIRLGMQRGALASPLIAGTYSDSVTVTIALAP